jgi:hypothetical protein
MGARVVLPAVVVLGACAPAAGIGAAEVDRAARGVHAADEAGAREVPQAGGYLELAERELARAEGQLLGRDADGARGWARRAWADAEVARILAVEVATRAAAQYTQAEAEAVSRALDLGVPRAGQRR